jgi:predicted metal-dependent hydrolase
VVHPFVFLALPAAFEHFTATISRDFLTHHYHWTQGKQNQAFECVNWHCLEEIEHQAVCLDVYKKKYSSSWRLVWILLLFWLPLTLASTFAIHLFLLHKDRVIYRPQN